VTITPLRWPIGYESQWFRQPYLSCRDDMVRDAGIVSASRVGCRVVREQEQIRLGARSGVVVVEVSVSV